MRYLAEKIFMPVLSGSIVIQYRVVTPGGKRIEPPEKGWRWSKELFEEKVKAGEIIFVDDETRVIRKIYLCSQKGRVLKAFGLVKRPGQRGKQRMK
jgi:adenine-specific DNA-methyltransferase